MKYYYLFTAYWVVNIPSKCLFRLRTRLTTEKTWKSHFLQSIPTTIIVLSVITFQSEKPLFEKGGIRMCDKLNKYLSKKKVSCLIFCEYMY